MIFLWRESTFYISGRRLTTLLSLIRFEEILLIPRWGKWTTLVFFIFLLTSFSWVPFSLQLIQIIFKNLKAYWEQSYLDNLLIGSEIQCCLTNIVSDLKFWFWILCILKDHIEGLWMSCTCRIMQRSVSERVLKIDFCTI